MKTPGNAYLIKRLLLCLLTGILISCASEEVEKSDHFKDRRLSGKIGDVAWTYLSGYASATGNGENGALHINLHATPTDNPCDSYITSNSVFFSIPNKPGVYPLRFDIEDWMNSQTATLYDTEKTIIATKGAIEILSITEAEIAGRIDASADDGSQVNGAFRVALCK